MNGEANEHSPLSSRTVKAKATATATAIAKSILPTTLRMDGYSSLATPSAVSAVATPYDSAVDGERTEEEVTHSGEDENENENDHGDEYGNEYGNEHGNEHEHEKSIMVVDIEEAIDRLGMGPFQYRVILACGLCFASDAMELQLLSFLKVVLKGNWGLSEARADSVVSVVFAGALLGSLLLTPLGDRWGRRPLFAIVAATISGFGVLTGFCTDFSQILVLRFLVGVGVGGLTIPYDALGEFLPSTFRGPSILCTSFFWTTSSLVVPLLAWLTLGSDNDNDNDNDGSDNISDNNISDNNISDNISDGDNSSWRSFVVLCAVPGLVSTVLGIVWVPESPRWLLTKGKHDKALGVLREAAATNGRDPFLVFPESTTLIDRNGNHNQNQNKNKIHNGNGKAASTNHRGVEESTRYNVDTDVCVKIGGVANHIPPTTIHNDNDDDFEPNGCVEPARGMDEHDRAGIRSLCSNTKWRRMGLFVGAQWYGLSFMYYGAILSISIVFSTLDDDDNNNGDNDHGRGYEFDYQALFITASAEIVGLIVAMAAIDRAGRVATQVGGYLLGGFFLLLLSLLDAYAYSGNSGSTASSSSSSSSKRWQLIGFAFLARLFVMTASSVTWLHTAELLPTEIRATGHGLANALGRIGGITCPFVISRDASLQTIGLVMFLVGVVTSFCIHQLPETTGKALGTFDVTGASHVSISSTVGRQLVRRSSSSSSSSNSNSNNLEISQMEGKINESAAGCGFQRQDRSETATDERFTSSFELI